MLLHMSVANTSFNSIVELPEANQNMKTSITVVARGSFNPQFSGRCITCTSCLLVVLAAQLLSGMFHFSSSLCLPFHLGTPFIFQIQLFIFLSFSFGGSAHRGLMKGHLIFRNAGTTEKAIH